MTHIDCTKSQMIYYCILTNLQTIHCKLATHCQKQSMNIYLEIPKMKKFLTHLNINTKKPLETMDTTISNENLIKPVTTMQKEIARVTSFGLIRLSIEQPPQILEKSLSDYYVTTSHPLTSPTKYLIRTLWSWATVALKT